MTTPLVTVANSIIEFILSLLRDPAALAELEKDPEAALLKNKVAGICADDVRAVAPIIYDRPDVVPRNTPASSSSTHHTQQAHQSHQTQNNDVLNEITRITNNWTTVDSRATIVDQSVNQNIWTEGGDVTQAFDQTAGVASGDGSLAAGDDVTAGPGAGSDDDGDDTPTQPGLPGIPDDDAPGVPDDAPGVPDDGSSDPDDALVDPGEVTGDTGEVPGIPDEAPGIDDLAADLDDADTLTPPVDDVPTAPEEPLAAAVEAGVPADAVDAVDSATADVAPPSTTPAYDAAPPAEVDDAVWSEPVDAVPVEEVVYPEEVEEQ